MAKRVRRTAVLASVVIGFVALSAPPAAADRICVTVTVDDPHQTVTGCVPLPPTP